MLILREVKHLNAEASQLSVKSFKPNFLLPICYCKANIQRALTLELLESK